MTRALASLVVLLVAVAGTPGSPLAQQGADQRAAAPNPCVDRAALGRFVERSAGQFRAALAAEQAQETGK